MNLGSTQPALAGVYAVVQDPISAPVFVEASCGHFKGKDPTVPVATLRANWVDGAPVLYIGKAGGGSSAATLRKRLGQYVKFGAGVPIGHWGGRYIWQLENPNSCLSFAWRPVRDTEDAVVLETQLLAEFVQAYGSRPFANLRD